MKKLMDTEIKTYVHWGYLITRHYHYKDAHQHYDYITNVEGYDVTFPSLAKAKKYISDTLHGRK